MARPTRFQYPGAIYHVMARGDGGKVVFEADDDRKAFVFRPAQVCESHGWRIHAWVLMGNHFRLLLETPQANLSWGRFLERGDAVVLDAEHVEKRVPEHLAFGFLRGGAFPIAGKGDGTVADFVPRKHGNGREPTEYWPSGEENVSSGANYNAKNHTFCDGPDHDVPGRVA